MQDAYNIDQTGSRNTVIDSMTGALNSPLGKRRLGAMAQMELHEPLSKVETHDGTQSVRLFSQQTEPRLQKTAVATAGRRAEHLMTKRKYLRHVRAGGG